MDNIPENTTVGKNSDMPVILNKKHNETLFSWLFSLGRLGVRNIPGMILTLAVQAGIVIFFQLIFWWDAISRYIPVFIKKPVIFLTATYNDVIPKTLYWIILFTFGKKLFDRIRKTGFKKAMRPIIWLVPELKKALSALEQKTVYFLLLTGGGTGLIIANNFASYSRFSGARNKMDKYFIALVISFTISYLLGEGRKHWIFKFSRLTVSDLTRLFRLKNRFTDNHTYIFASSFVAGLLADAPIIMMKLEYGGYILGALCLAGSIALSIAARFRRSMA